MDDMSKKGTGLIEINRYNNLMSLVNREYGGKIQDLCRKLAMPHLASFLSHKGIPKKQIGKRMARVIEEKLALSIQSLDSSQGHHVTEKSTEFVENCPIKQARYENLNRLLQLHSRGNISHLNSFLDCKLSNYLGRKRTRSLGDKMTAKIEAKLGVPDGSFDTIQEQSFFFTRLSKVEQEACIKQLQASFSDILETLNSINRQQEAIIIKMLSDLAVELANTNGYSVMKSDDLRRLYLPYVDKNNHLPVLVKPSGSSGWKFWILGLKGMNTGHEKQTKATTDAIAKHKKLSLQNVNSISLSVVDPVNHNHSELGPLSRDAHLIIKRATYALQYTVDEALSLRMSLKQAYNSLVDAQAIFIVNSQQLPITMKSDEIFSGFQIPRFSFDFLGQSAEALLVPLSANGVHIKEVKEYVRQSYLSSKSLQVLPVYMYDGELMFEQLTPAKIWLRLV
ncbi:hypothetical protein ACFSF3_06425 [Vibrio chagasii]